MVQVPGGYWYEHKNKKKKFLDIDYEKKNGRKREAEGRRRYGGVMSILSIIAINNSSIANCANIFV